MQCGHCGEENEDGFKFCSGCGQPLFTPPASLAYWPTDRLPTRRRRSGLWLVVIAAAGCAGLAALVGLFLYFLIGSGPNPLGSLSASVIPTDRSGAKNGKTAPSPTPKPIYKMGELMAVGNWEYNVAKVEKSKTLAVGDANTSAQGLFLSIYITLKNVGARESTLNTWDFELHDASGIKYDPHSQTFMLAKSKNLAVLGDSLTPGQALNTILVFDINAEAKGLKLWVGQAHAYVDLGQ